MTIKISEQQAQTQIAEIVSRETMDRFVEIVAALRLWSKRFNLVSPASRSEIWSRHILDSVQLFTLAPNTAKHWLDLGSGAGFPGMVLAIMLLERPEAQMVLVEANGKKAAFLQHCARITGAPVSVLQQRIENTALAAQDVITARAVTDLSGLLELSRPFVGKDTVLLFPKGKNVEDELTQAHKQWDIKVEVLPSMTDKYAKILKIKEIHRV